jgi:hypothetical protein
MVTRNMQQAVPQDRLLPYGEMGWVQQYRHLVYKTGIKTD